MTQKQATYETARVSEYEAREVTMTLPIPPSANRYWRSYGGHVVVSSEARDYKAAVRYSTLGVRPFDGLVAVNVTVFRERKAGDLDNYLKILLDALKGVLYDDDSAVVEIHAFREDDKSHPRVEVVAWEAR